MYIYIYDFLLKPFRTISQILSTLVRFLLTASFCCHLIANIMILLIVSLLLTSLSNNFLMKRNKSFTALC